MTPLRRFLLENETTTYQQKIQLARIPDIGHHALLSLASHHPEHSPQENQDIRHAVASNPGLFKGENGQPTSKVVKKILKHSSNRPGTYAQIGRQNHNLEKPLDHVFKMLANHSSANARKIAADFRPHENYEKLKDDSSPLVHASLAKEFPEKYDHDKAPMGARIISGMAKHGPDNHLEDHIDKEHPEIRSYVARNTQRHETMEHMAVNEKHPRVLERLARNHNIPEHVKIFLAGHKDRTVRKIAKYQQ